ncbi:hypothetical protein BV20DRAFT_165799 [Pilatotrama ljubarskyi]|nr:hypothetical protein BV20DRAFT_165799 [Pilatotrama ljubarskyi]
MAYGTRAKTTAASGAAAARPNYRALAGIEEENSRREAEAKKAAIAQRIAELEEEMARQDELRVDQAIASRASKVTSKLRKTGAKVKKLSRADIEAAKHAKENESSGKRRPTDEDAPAFQATSTPAKRSKGAAGPSGLRAGWQPQRTPTPTVPQRASVVSNTKISGRTMKKPHSQDFPQLSNRW